MKKGSSQLTNDNNNQYKFTTNSKFQYEKQSQIIDP